MGSRTTDALVAEIKTLASQRKEEKLQIQKDMVELRDEHNWSTREIAAATEIPQQTVVNWLQAYDEAVTNLGQPSRLTPQSVQAASDRRVAQRVLREQPTEVVEQMIRELPRERRQAVLAEFGDGYAQARRDFDERERNLTPAQRSEREAAGDAVTKPIREAMAHFAVPLKVVPLLEEATDALRELISDHSLTPELISAIDEADAEWRTELEVARAMAGLEVQS